MVNGSWLMAQGGLAVKWLLMVDGSWLMAHGSREPGPGGFPGAMSHETLTVDSHLIDELFDYSWYVAGIQSFKVSKVQSFRDSRFQDFQNPRSQNSKTSKL